MEKEVWTICKENENYMVSSYGRVYSKISKKFLKQSQTDRGYLYVELQSKKYKVHRLVLNNFLWNIFEKATINHKDRDKKNNFLSNLEYMTQEENNKHAKETNFIYVKPTEHIKKKQFIKPKQVLQYNLNGEFITNYVSICQAAKATKSQKTKISECLKGKALVHNGFIWKEKTELKIKLKIQPYNGKNNGEKKVKKYSIDGNFISLYNSVTLAAKENEVHGCTLQGISKAALQNKGKHRNFIWEYEKEGACTQ